MEREGESGRERERGRERGRVTGDSKRERAVFFADLRWCLEKNVTISRHDRSEACEQNMCVCMHAHISFARLAHTHTHAHAHTQAHFSSEKII